MNLTLCKWKRSNVIRAHSHRQACNPAFLYASTLDILYTPENNVLVGRLNDIEQITDKQEILNARISIPSLPQAASEDFQPK